MHRRKWPEIIKAVAKTDLTVDVYFEDGKIINLDLKTVQQNFEPTKEQLTCRRFESFHALPHALFWEAQPGYSNELEDEIELSGGDIYNGSYNHSAKVKRK